MAYGGWCRTRVRRAFTVYILRVLLPSRAPGVSVPEVANLLELRTMLAETVLDWKKQWLEEGKAEGMAEGKATGVVEGKAASLERLLTRRFGPPPDWVAARLKGAPVDQLDTWFDRALDAEPALATADAVVTAAFRFKSS